MRKQVQIKKSIAEKNNCGFSLKFEKTSKTILAVG
jgi:hypothetical protein